MSKAACFRLLIVLLAILLLANPTNAGFDQYVMNFIVPNTPPVLAGIPDENTNEDTDLIDIFDLDDYASDADGDPLTFQVESNNQSANVTIDINAGNTVDFHLAANWHGTAAVTFNVSDGNGGTDNDSMILTVNSINDPPVMDPIGSITENENETVIIDVDATDPDGDTITYACNRTDLFSDFDTGNGMGTWGTNYSSAGVYYVNFSVSDGNSGEDYEVVTITIVDIPLIISTHWNNVTGSSLTVSVEPGDTVLFGVTTNRTATNISWYNGTTHLENDSATSQGNLSHQFNSQGTFSINVSAVDAYDTTVNTTFTVSVGYAVPTVVTYSPTTPHISRPDVNVTFNVTFSQTGNITWYLDGVQTHINYTTTSASYSNTSPVDGGPYNVTASFTNDNGSVAQTWDWTVRPSNPILYKFYILIIGFALLATGYTFLVNDANNYTNIITGYLAGILYFIGGYYAYIGIGIDKVHETATFSGGEIASTVSTVVVTTYQYDWLGLLFIVIGMILILYSFVLSIGAVQYIIATMEKSKYDI